MKILLIHPPITLHKLDVSIPKKSTLVGLRYIGSVLRQAGYDVKIMDCLVTSHYNFPVDSDFTRFGLSDVKILDKIKSFAPDVVGISCMFTPYFKDAHNIAKIAKEYDEDILVVFGGAHTSTFPEAVMKDDHVDIAVIGEGEITILEVLDRYKNKKNFEGVKGIIHRIGGKIKKEKARDLIQNLDDIPFPDMDLLDEEDFEIIQEENHRDKFLMKKSVGYILTSRGCPKNCYFCSSKLIWRGKWRPRSARNVVDEIKFLKDKYGFEEFHFVDDNCSVSKKRMHEICDELIKRKLKVKLAPSAGIAIDALDKEILAKMKKAGFYRLCFGLESGNSATQKIINKRINLNQAKEVVFQANKLGFWTSATFIIGFPHETAKEINNTINFAKETDMDFAIFYLLAPQPGTEVYSILKAQGLIDLDAYIDPLSDDWYKISVVYWNGFRTNLFSNEDLQGILSRAYKEFIFYKLFSFRTYGNILKKIKSFEDLMYTLRLINIPVNMLLRKILGKDLSYVAIRDRKRDLKYQSY